MGRKRKYENSHVISIRISDEELQDITQIMELGQIKRVSDLMRQALEMMTEKTDGFQRAHAQDHQPVLQNAI